MRARFPVLPLLEFTADAGNDIPTASKHKLKNKKLKKDRENKGEENQEKTFSVWVTSACLCTWGVLSAKHKSKKL